jgi:hypothetical protein
LKDEGGHTLITAYAVSRPDGQWSVMIINKDQSNPHDIKLAFEGAGTSGTALAGPITMTTFGSEQYMWKSEGPNSHPDPNQPPISKTLPPSTSSVTLPKASVTILRAKLAS